MLHPSSVWNEKNIDIYTYDILSIICICQNVHRNIAIRKLYVSGQLIMDLYEVPWILALSRE